MSQENKEVITESQVQELNAELNKVKDLFVNRDKMVKQLQIVVKLQEDLMANLQDQITIQEKMIHQVNRVGIIKGMVATASAFVLSKLIIYIIS